ncbi:hypothetical protein EVAR_28933_1 [Eumeta japonica]|uniref:Uncharacterized protein n=1 Tax=Eumeta variegata TaxID=151549 RepID=A0A4C1YN42_EUMVA|nr:hypothetical protein EVAR_28933_1 [Eumeta japonica]
MLKKKRRQKARHEEKQTKGVDKERLRMKRNDERKRGILRNQIKRCRSMPPNEAVAATQPLFSTRLMTKIVTKLGRAVRRTAVPGRVIRFHTFTAVPGGGAARPRPPPALGRPTDRRPGEIAPICDTAIYHGLSLKAIAGTASRQAIARLVEIDKKPARPIIATPTSLKNRPRRRNRIERSQRRVRALNRPGDLLFRRRAATIYPFAIQRT